MIKTSPVEWIIKNPGPTEEIPNSHFALELYVTWSLLIVTPGSAKIQIGANFGTSQRNHNYSKGIIPILRQQNE